MFDNAYRIKQLIVFVLLTLLVSLTTLTTNAKQWQPKPEEPVFTTNPPSADAPLCSYHNPNEWHGIWDSARNCHYAHEHKDNPGILYEGMPAKERESAERLLQIFGPPGQWFGGTSISYPWQTFHGAGPTYGQSHDPAKVENRMKHEGYGWIARANLPKRGGQYISDFRLQYHAIFAAPGATTRYHSFSLEANVCNSRTGCRIVRTGGWLDFGVLRISGNPVKLPNQEGDGNRQRLHRHYVNTAYAANDNFKTPAVWYGQMIHPQHLKDNFVQADVDRPFRTLTIALETYDSWSNAHHSDPFTNYFFCPAFDCNKNGSTIKMHRMRLDFVLEDGYTAFTDRFGRTNPDCTHAGLDCIPTSINPGTRISTAYSDQGAPREYDWSPEGVWWIKYPN